MAGPQFTLWSHDSGPNGWKVVILLKALGLTYETKWVDFQAGTQKSPEHIALNPNGRIPTLIDNTTGVTLFESDAILLYLVDKYDTEKKFTVTSEPEKYKLLQWLFFQASGQGPYYGQAAHFSLFAPEKIPYAIERYGKEILRVLGVLEIVLSKQKYLLGEQLTIADLSFITWNAFGMSGLLTPKTDFAADFPAVHKWHSELLALPYVAATFAEKEAAGKK